MIDNHQQGVARGQVMQSFWTRGRMIVAIIGGFVVLGTQIATLLVTVKAI